MSTEKLAKLLEVDEVSLMHGPKGVALYVRIGNNQNGVTIDNEDLEHNRMEVMAKSLIELSDGLQKSLGRQASLRKTFQAEQSTRRMLSWDDVGGYVPWDNDARQRQVQRVEPSYPSRPPPATAAAEPAVSKSLPSRFHAIVDELRNL